MSKKVIIQLLMGLEIGGAETHVIETSIELKKRGYKVIVVSSGGDYQNYLKENNIETIYAPLDRKDIGSIKESYGILKKIIVERNPLIVHSHARIPSLIVEIVKRLNKKLIVNFITTVHGKFKINFILKKMTFWGEKSFVVSEDLKEYLIEGYNIDPKNIYLNINGINTEKFKKTDRKKTFDIIHVSRLENDTIKLAKKLIEVAKGNTDIKIGIIGDGSKLEELRELSKKINNIEFLGKSLEVEKYLDSTKIFVGISRASLEAMLYNIPVVLGGEYGYFGILSENNIKENVDNNFTCRGFEEITLEKLEKDIKIALDKEYSEKNYLWSRKYVENNYSVKKMVDIYEKVYFLYEES